MDKREFRKLIARQRGVFSAEQASRYGVDRNRLYRMCGSGEVKRVLPRVYRLVGTPHSFEQRLASIHLWAGPGAAFSHRTAGCLHGLSDRPACVEITTHRSLKSPDPGIIVYRRSHLDGCDVSRLYGVPLTTLPRTLIDMSAVSSLEELDLALDAAIRMRMSRDLFLARLDDLAKRGRPGVWKLRRLVAERVHEQGMAESPFERRLLRLLRKAKLPLPVCQMGFCDQEFKARVDFAYPDKHLVIEADSYRWHGSRTAFERDRVRWSELASRGWRVLLVTHLQLKYRPDEVVRRVSRALEGGC